MLVNLPTASSPHCPWTLTFHWTGQCNHRNPGRLWSHSMGQQDSHPHQSCAAGWVWCSPWRDSPARHQSLALILCISHTWRARQRDHMGSVLPHSQLSCHTPIIGTLSQIPGILSSWVSLGRCNLTYHKVIIPFLCSGKTGKLNPIEKPHRSPSSNKSILLHLTGTIVTHIICSSFIGTVVVSHKTEFVIYLVPLLSPQNCNLANTFFTLSNIIIC